MHRWHRQPARKLLPLHRQSRLPYQAILANPKVIKTLEDIKADDDTAPAEQKRITEIPAPPYKEHVRAEYYL